MVTALPLQTSMLRQFALEELSLNHVIFGRAWQLDFNVHHDPAVLTWTQWDASTIAGAKRQAMSEDSAYKIVLSVHEESFMVRLARTQALDRALGLPLADVAPALQSAVLFDELLSDLLGDVFGVSADLVDPRNFESGRSGTSSLPFSLDLRGQRLFGTMELSPSMRAMLSDALGARPCHALQDLDFLSLPTQVTLAGPRLPINELMGLGVGDLMILSSAEPHGCHGALGTGAGQPLACRLDHRNLTLTMKETCMSDDLTFTRDFSIDDPAATEFSDNSAGDALASMHVQLTATLESIPISLAQLRSVTPGFILPLTQPVIGASVVLKTAGSTVGRGELIALGEQLAVRVTSMKLHG